MYTSSMSSIREVAKQAGVSPATVSRAFASPELINVHTQQRVLEVARLLNYRPPRLRGGLRGNRLTPAPMVPRPTGPSATSVHDAIGFQFFSATNADSDTLFHNTFYAPVLAGAQAEAASLGMHLLIHSTNRQALAVELPRMIEERAIGGMLLAGTADPAVLHTLAAHVREIVLVDSRDDTGPYESVVSDGFGGAFEATRYLLELGHRRLGFFPDAQRVLSFQERLRGFVAAQFEAGLTANPAWVLGGGEDAEAQRLSLLSFLSETPAGERPTALLCANDYNALIALRACRDIGLRVPEDISLIGFDDIYYAAHADPPLTTVRVDKEYMGRLAVRLLSARLRGDAPDTIRGERGKPLSVCHQIPVSLVLRDSCCAV